MTRVTLHSPVRAGIATRNSGAPGTGSTSGKRRPYASIWGTRQTKSRSPPRPYRRAWSPACPHRTSRRPDQQMICDGLRSLAASLLVSNQPHEPGRAEGGDRGGPGGPRERRRATTWTAQRMPLSFRLGSCRPWWRSSRWATQPQTTGAPPRSATVLVLATVFCVL